MQYKMFLLSGLLTAGLFAADTVKRLANSAEVFQEIMEVADRAIPQKLLDKSECIVVVPGMKKGAFFVGGKYAAGLSPAAAHRADGDRRPRSAWRAAVSDCRSAEPKRTSSC